MPQSTEPLQELLDKLQTQQKLKAWSLIMTFFGDMVAPRGGMVAARTVRTVMHRLGIEDGTVRTAFSRLASDGWLIRHKTGRNSFYELTQQSLDQFEVAAAIIYAKPETTNEPIDNTQYVLAISSHAASAGHHPLKEKAIQLNPTCLLFKKDCALSLQQIEHDDYLVVTGTLNNFPSWVYDIAINNKLQKGYQNLQLIFSPITQFQRLNPLDTVALRCTLIHEWRKLVLKDAPHTHPFQSKNKHRHRCHQFVASSYLHLQTSSDEWLNQHAMGIDGTLKLSENARKPWQPSA